MYPEQPSTGVFGKAHPVMLIGIILFILPYINHWDGFKWVPGWFAGLGIMLIIIGAIASMYNASNQ